MFKQFFYMIINTLFIPITQTTTISSFLYLFAEKDIDDLQMELSEKFLKTSEFFLKYIIQCTFMTNMVQILDVPHFLYLGIKRFLSRPKEWETGEDGTGGVEDDWYFDIGYHFAFSITIFTVVLIFSASVPLIPLFGFLFFAFKYFIDKYNFLFVYQTEFQSRGNVGQSVIRYTTFSLVMFQAIMCGLFTSIFGRDFIIASIILLLGEILYMIIFRVFSLSDLKEALRELLKEQQDTHVQFSQEVTSLLKSRTLDLDDQAHLALSEKHEIVLKDAYLHPYEKYHKEENARRQLNIFLKKELKQRIEKKDHEIHHSGLNEPRLSLKGARSAVTRTQTLRSPQHQANLSLYRRH
jgi:hypothetical protein